MLLLRVNHWIFYFFHLKLFGVKLIIKALHCNQQKKKRKKIGWKAICFNVCVFLLLYIVIIMLLDAYHCK